jgi:hypothetical protein
MVAAAIRSAKGRAISVFQFRQLITASEAVIIAEVIMGIMMGENWRFMLHLK